MEGIKEMIKAAGADAPRFISKLFRVSRPDYSSRASCWLLCRSLARKRVRKQGDNSRFHVRYVRSEKRHRFILVPWEVSMSRKAWLCPRRHMWVKSKNPTQPGRSRRPLEAPDQRAGGVAGRSAADAEQHPRLQLRGAPSQLQLFPLWSQLISSLQRPASP